MKMQKTQREAKKLKLLPGFDGALERLGRWIKGAR